MSEPLLSAMVSTYASERFLRGCLDSLLAQTLGDRLEIVVVDACSPQGEGAIVRDYQQRHRNIRYVRTATRENTSQAFDRATALARGRYLTTANADDRHRPDFAVRMVEVLERHRDVALVYADSLITHVANETWSDNTAAKRYAWPDFAAATALSCCLFGAQPVWRKSVHEVVGGWNPEHVHANDQDMFLRIALRFGAVHVREALGLFLMRDDSVSGAANRGATLAEVLAVMRRYRTATPLATIFPGLQACQGDAAAQAAALFELGNLCALGPYTDAELALDCYRRAAALPLPAQVATAARMAFANNVGCVLAAAGQPTRAEAAWRLSATRAQTRNNRELLQRHRTPRLHELQFVELDHAVVASSRQGRGLQFGASGALEWGNAISRRPWQVYDGPDGVMTSRTERVCSLPLASPRVSAPPVSSLQSGPPQAIAPQCVLVVMYGWADSGGGTMLPRAFAKQLAENGHATSVFYAAARTEVSLPAYGVRRHQEAGVQLFGLCNRPSDFMDLQAPAREVDDPAARAAFAAVLDEVQPDVVHFWNLHNLGMSLPGECRQRGIPTVLSSNNYWALCPRLYLISEQLHRCSGASDDGRKCATCLGTPNAAAAQAARKAQGVRMLRDDIDVHLAVSTRVRDLYVQNGDDAQHVRVLRQEPPSVASIWERTGAPRHIVAELRRPLRVGFIGSVMAHKGVHVLAQALQLLPEGSVQAIALGDVAGDYLPALRQIDPTGRLHLCGRYEQAKLPELLATLDVVVVPSVWDDCAPFVVAEALAARCPVLGARIGGIVDFVQHGENGLLFAPGDAEQLSRCIAAFAVDATLLGKLQAAIEAPRGLGAFTADVVSIYGEVISTAAVPALPAAT